MRPRAAMHAAALITLTAAFFALALLPAGAAAQTPEPEPERVQEAKLARSGAGLRVSYWSVRGLPEVEATSDDRWPLIEGYFQRGLDRHLAVESTVGVWRRQIQTEDDGGLLGGGSAGTETIWLVPLFTAIKFHPFTGPEATTEPYISAGVGVALGIREAEGGGLTGGGTTSGTGFGAKGEAGVALRLGAAFALNLFGGYQWLRFGNELGGTKTYAGPNFGAGLSYRFQY